MAATGSRSVPVISMLRFSGAVVRHSRDADGRISSIDLDCGICIVTVYAPNKNKAQGDFFKTVAPYLVVPLQVVLVGDFDCLR